jgi:hypothetical protein
MMEEFIKNRIEFLENILDDFGILEEAFFSNNDFPRLAKTKDMIQDILDELEAARKGFDAHSKWLKNKANCP